MESWIPENANLQYFGVSIDTSYTLCSLIHLPSAWQWLKLLINELYILFFWRVDCLQDTPSTSTFSEVWHHRGVLWTF